MARIKITTTRAPYPGEILSGKHVRVSVVHDDGTETPMATRSVTIGPIRRQDPLTATVEVFNPELDIEATVSEG